MKKIKKIEGVKSILCLNKIFLFERVDGQIFINEKQTNYNESFSSKDYMIFLYENSKTIILNSLNENKINVPVVVNELNYYPLNKVVIPFDFEQQEGVFTSKWGIYQLEPFVHLNDFNYRYAGFGRILNDFIVIQSNQMLQNISLLTGEYEWQTDLSSYGTIRKVLGVCGENVWVTTQYLDEHRTSTAHLIALNIHTGEILHHLSDNLPLHEVHIELIEETQTILSAWGKISTHRKAESPFVEIDAKTGSVLRNTYSETLFEANLKLGGWKYFNGKLFFDAAFDTINSTHIGVMDFNTLKLEWFEEVKERKAGLKNLQVTENKIYVMDSGHQLFIYEKIS